MEAFAKNEKMNTPNTKRMKYLNAKATFINKFNLHQTQLLVWGEETTHGD
jgi:hypothetical protein